MKNCLYLTMYLCVACWMFFLNTSTVSAQTDQPKRVLFINQVRGNECCDNGSIYNLKKQIGAFTENQLPATFTLRYDAIIDPEFSSVLKDLDLSQFELGVLLEITPRLASDSAVTYAGDEETWYQAQQVYTIGYSISDRKKLIDTVFKAFHMTFGYYPQVTTAWMIDTDSQQYIQDTYGVRIHQLTREQFGTDSYTLYGGPFHYPYLASKNWLLIPCDQPLSDCKQHSPLILRQTVSDPLQNYGDTNSTFTSQPNDYVRDGKDFSYFEKLLNQTLNQSINPYSIAILGLENSMDSTFQDEYQKQIQWITKYLEEKPEMKALKASDFHQEFLEKWADFTTTTLIGKNLTNDQSAEALWINTPHYRMRILKQNQTIKITDLRIYSNQLTDPYNTSIAEKLGYWITPFLIDSSRFHAVANTTESSDHFWQRARQAQQEEARPLQEIVHLPTWRSDFSQDEDLVGLQLPDIQGVWSFSSGSQQSLQLDYETQQQEKITLVFYKDHFVINSNSSNEVFRTDHWISAIETPFIKLKTVDDVTHLIEWVDDHTGDVSSQLEIRCPQPNNCIFSPLILGSREELAGLVKQFPPFLFPEKVGISEAKNTVLTMDNRYVIAGKKPVTMALIPRDKFNYSTLQSIEPTIKSVPQLNDFSIEKSPQDGKLFIKAIENRVGKYQIEIDYDGIIQKETIYFSPNCKDNFWYCLRHPLQSVWYLRAN